MRGIWSAFRASVAIQSCLNYEFARGIDIDMGNTQSIKDVSKQLAASIMDYYHGNEPGQTPGLIAGSSSWWEAGAMFTEMIEYWYYTGDTKYNNLTMQALLHQVGPNNAYEPTNQTRVEGNDDQAFWAFAAMSAAEFKFPDPPDPKQPQWLALAMAVFNNQAHRWDDAHCGGGLRWQFNMMNAGWMYKNTISNGCFFQLAARLARYTKNETYAEWANKAYDWMAKSPIISDKYEVFDGIDFTETSCDESGMKDHKIQWTYNLGTILAGASFMYNHTTGAEQETWKKRITGYLNHSQEIFFPTEHGGKTLTEYACESPTSTPCSNDARTFKAYFTRWLAVTAQLAPFTTTTIMPWLRTSAQKAVNLCSGGPPGGIVCGERWYGEKDDGLRDLGFQMTALSVLQSNLVLGADALMDLKTGTSVGDVGAGGSVDHVYIDPVITRTITAADRAGGWLFTVAMFGLLASGTGWLVAGEFHNGCMRW